MAVDATLLIRDDGPRAAPAVVLLHGIATNADLWAPQVPAWSRSFRLLRVDLPGHGGSPTVAHAVSTQAIAEAVREALEELGVDRAAWVGLSLGAMVAQAFVVAHPEKVRSLVLAHTGARSTPTVREIWDKRLTAARSHGMSSQVEESLGRWFTPAFAARAPMTLAWAADMVLATSVEGYEHAARAIQNLDHLEALARVRRPALVLSADADHVIPPAAAQAVADAIPGARHAVIEDAAHLANLEQPVAFTETVGAFLLETRDS